MLVFFPYRERYLGITIREDFVRRYNLVHLSSNSVLYVCVFNERINALIFDRSEVLEREKSNDFV